MSALYRLLTGAVLAIGYRWYRVTQRRHGNTISWVVGIEEIAGVVRNLADAIPGSHAVSLYPHPFYSHRYDTEWHGSGAPGLVERIIRRPLLLARLASRATGFIYVGRRGYLGSASRAIEFSFLRRHGIHLVCYFTGSDIRAPQLLEQFERETGVPTVGSLYRRVSEMHVSDAYDRAQRATGEEADRYADVVFTAAVDQLGYLDRPTEPFLYFLPEDAFLDERVPRGDRAAVVLHAPSSQVFKGTELVRDAVETLRAEGIEFEYIELNGVPHDQVREALARTDIVLNQFYALMPGVFGMEALAARCAVLMSADGDIESDLPPGANEAWCVTRATQVTDHLRELLRDPERVSELAERGYEWARRYASSSSSAARLNDILSKVVDGSYQGPSGWHAEPSSRAVRP